MTEPDTTRRMRLETDHGDRETATILARAVQPDNTDEIDTRVDGSRVVTTVTRGTTGGLQSTVDDYVVNLQVAARVADSALDAAPNRERNHNTDIDGASTGSTTTEPDRHSPTDTHE